MKRFFKILLIILGLFALGVVIFVALRIRENDQKAAARQTEAEKTQVSLTEAQQLDLGGFNESDFRLLSAPAAGISAPTQGQWLALRQGLAVAPALARLLPLRSPVVSSGFGPLRYAVHPDSWRVLIDCRPEMAACTPLVLAVSTLSEDEADEFQAGINSLASAGTAVYAALHGRRGTEGMDNLIKEGNIPMLYNEFCSELGCHGSVSFTVGQVLVRVEGGGDLQPWFRTLAQSGGAGGQR